jgi:adenylate kinase family enzyme
MQPITVAFFGISGSGKGTQAELLEKHLREKDPTRGVIRPEMGKLLRNFMQQNTSLAKKINDIVESGGLVPSFVASYLLAVLINDSFDGTQHMIFDGTCRKPDQSRAVDDIVHLWGRKDRNVIVLKISKESAKSRLGGRGREDDLSDETIERRFSWYNESVVPAIAELKILGWNVHEIDGEPELKTIHKNILSVLGLAG